MGWAMSDQRGFFDLDERYAALSRAGDPLERLSSVIDFEIFRVELKAALKAAARTSLDGSLLDVDISSKNVSEIRASFRFSYDVVHPRVCTCVGAWSLSAGR